MSPLGVALAILLAVLGLAGVLAVTRARARRTHPPIRSEDNS